MNPMGTLQNPQIRVRNKRGQYESVDMHQASNFGQKKHDDGDQMKYAE